MDKPRDALFNVAQLLKEQIGAARDFEVVVPIQHLLPELISAEPLAGHVHLLRTDRGVLVQAELSGRVVVPCSRCLVDVSAPIDVVVEEQFQPTVDVVRGIFVEVDEEDEALLIDEHHILDLHEVLRQEVLLAAPMQPLCKPDCAGLCPTCGQDRNVGPCACAQADVDARWADLGSLLDDVEV